MRTFIYSVNAARVGEVDPPRGRQLRALIERLFIRFHPACVAISEGELKAISSFYCPTCEVADDDARAGLASGARIQTGPEVPRSILQDPPRSKGHFHTPKRVDPMDLKSVYELSEHE